MKCSPDTPPPFQKTTSSITRQAYTKHYSRSQWDSKHMHVKGDRGDIEGRKLLVDICTFIPFCIPAFLDSAGPF